MGKLHQVYDITTEQDQVFVGHYQTRRTLGFAIDKIF